MLLTSWSNTHEAGVPAVRADREAETDRMLVAQARLETLVLVTADVALTSY